MEVCTADSRMGHSDEHIVSFQILSLALSLLDRSLLGALKHGEFDGHFDSGRRWYSGNSETGFEKSPCSGNLFIGAFYCTSHLPPPRWALQTVYGCHWFRMKTSNSEQNTL
jgi:hypothetical protein